MKKKLYALVTIAALSLLFSCSKSDPAPTKTDLVTRAGGWAFTSKKLDATELIAACDVDDLIIFSKNKTLTITYGSILCSLDQVTETGSWDIYGTNESLLNINKTGGNIDYNILELTSTALKISYLDPGTGKTSTFTFVGK